MSYPLSESFATTPATGYIAVLGGISATHNSAQQSIDTSASNSQSILRFNETAHGSFWFETDIELLTDPSARRHIGLWMTTGNGSEGYRFVYLDGSWGVFRWNNGFSDGARVTGGVNDGARPIAGLADVVPTFNVSQRPTLRYEVVVGASDTNGVPQTWLIQFKADGVLVFQIGDAAYRGKLIPDVSLYGAAARVHAIAGDTPSGLPASPTTVGMNAGDDPLPPAGGSTSVPPNPAANISVNAQVDLSRLSNPPSNHWNRGGGYDWQFHSIPNGRKSVHFSDHGFIVGTVKEKGQLDQSLARRVQLISESTRVPVAKTWSGTGGNYQLELLDPTQRYIVVGYDHKQTYRAMIADNLRPEMIP